MITDQDQRRWRVGDHDDIQIYADRIPIATAMTPESARQIVAEHNLLLDLRGNGKVMEQHTNHEKED